ncbi:hypothetical protein LguiA_011143 [Lonicera macranthoides]
MPLATLTLTQNPNPKPPMLPCQLKSPVTRGGLRCLHISRTISPAAVAASSRQQPLRYAVIGAGFAGLSVSWHLLQQSPKEAHLRIDIYDEFGIGGGASGVSGGLLHPYSPKGKPLWRAEECWKESLRLLSIAEAAVGSKELMPGGRVLAQSSERFIVRRRGILRPAVSLKNIDAMNDNAQNCLAGCRIESIDKDIAQKLVPNLCIPFNAAFYMPEAVNVHPQRYLEALYRACETLVENLSISGFEGKMVHLHKKSVHSLLELAGEYDAVIICAGARASFLPELSGRLPLRMCRGVIANLQLPDDDDNREEYPEHGPSILSDAWLAIHGSRELHMGSTWEWNSTNYSQSVPNEEASKAVEELVPKVLAIYPGIKNWNLTGARAGLRAMPPLTSNGSLPLLGRVDDFIGEVNQATSKWQMFTGLKSIGILLGILLGNVIAKAVLCFVKENVASQLTEKKSVPNASQKNTTVMMAR